MKVVIVDTEEELAKLYKDRKTKEYTEFDRMFLNQKWIIYDGMIVTMGDPIPVDIEFCLWCRESHFGYSNECPHCGAPNNYHPMILRYKL